MHRTKWRIEAATQNDQAACAGCGRLFHAREGRFAVK
jgi:hypothetical protein